MQSSRRSVTDRFSTLHERFVLRHPLIVLVVCAVVVLVFGWNAQKFSLDATADSLTLERDADLRYYRMVRARYGSDDFLVVTFSPDKPLFAEATLEKLKQLRDHLRELDGVESVVSILDVPLIKSPPLDIREIDDGIRRLESDETDRSMAREELLNSVLYRELIISVDGRTTALRVNLRQDARYLELRALRDELRQKGFRNELTAADEARLANVSKEFDEVTQALLGKEQETIAAVREVLQGYRDIARLHIGGVPMIVADSIDFIRHDLVVFGMAVIAFLIVILVVAFRQPRWAILTLANCLATCVVMLGLLGLTNWHVTVVSSNFVSLLLILCLALTLHIIVRYREAHLRSPDAGQLELVRESIRRIIAPCLYTALTTMVAFGSLIVSGIRPVIDFGWMMVIGIAIGFVFSFTLFPAGLMLFKPGKPRVLRDITAAITAAFARMIDGRSKRTIQVSVALAMAGLLGISQLTIENRFIDYYKKSTDIYQGMELVDRALGGTTPLDVVIDAPQPNDDEPVDDTVFGDDTDGFDDAAFAGLFDDDMAGEGGITSTSYWFNNPRLNEVAAIHDYLDSLDETGKVISVATTARLLQELDEDILSDNVLLSIVYKRLPEDVREALIRPYLSPDGNQVRFSVRVFESDKSLRRNQLIERIGRELIEKFDLHDDQVHLSGMLVLYNNMLQSLFRSQILTLAAVFLVIFIMFLVLFRRVRLAVTAIIPNVLSAIVVLGLIGWLGIPLDLMTITIAAITVGIAVDDTIHYMHRFTTEFLRDGDYWAAIHRCHRTIGRAMYYTSVTIMLGFSILALSQFTPTIYFGLLTGIAMLVALVANMTLLPVLLVAFRACDVHRPEVR
ncbi:MAG: MMPL family transporter [Gammaproteobacteria bacterium]|nr:MMPL family transporter [Gammaproteobacteria bacterium]